MQQWEYKIEVRFPVPDIEDQIAFLNDEGKLGWENHYVNKNLFYFKRPIQQPSTVEKIFNEAVKEATDELSGRHPFE